MVLLQKICAFSVSLLKGQAGISRGSRETCWSLKFDSPVSAEEPSHNTKRGLQLRPQQRFAALRGVLHQELTAMATCSCAMLAAEGTLCK